ncbi:hypothetical protein EDB81DRAFT_879022 [Dactylonectria macrodidyma]|uniref:Cell wall galactomannoprotein n=1 Tax=Dactylonectria macrodidyma TaxID=307937 RepID=A0A9P9JBP6_9HYPO|nr:hypothetical protein EDB81DRAFT_879022 [Dactylonectria macrodidyma]
MQFKRFTVITGMLAISSVHAAVNMTDIIGDIGDIASLAGEIVTLCSNLDITTILTSAPKIVENIGQIVEIITSDAEAIGSDTNSTTTSLYSTSDETEACDGLQMFLESVGQVAGSVADNLDVVSNTPFSGAVSDIISSIKDGVDEFGSKILEIVPSCNETTSSYSLESVEASFNACLEKLS